MKNAKFSRLIGIAIIGILLFAGWGAAFTLGKSIVATRVPGSVHLNGRATADAEVFRTNTNAPLVRIGDEYYLLSPFLIISEDAIWRLGDNLLSYREIYSDPDIFVDTYKWQPPYEPNLIVKDGTITFTTYDGRVVTVIPNPALILRIE